MELNVTSNSVTPVGIDTPKVQSLNINEKSEENNVLASTETVNKLQDGSTVNVQQQSIEEQVKEELQEEKEARTPEEMEEVTAKLSDMMAMLRKGLTFKVDDSLGTQVVSVLDIDTGELIRQIPNEEALELAIKLHEKMAEMDGLLMSTEV
ncbi:flagellar protein FlaG [Shewanella kaireitica]|uniref:flagellar protein FlaG n=1 Tax=Shewanella kaireitica TaxID=212021 RepID=UPI00200BA6BE|nr:flagellar protein FlaG [Shewanella kaireitica]MCL1093751.1 flagellar protein FlaG [Shewanella kaireitica]